VQDGEGVRIPSARVRVRPHSWIRLGTVMRVQLSGSQPRRRNVPSYEHQIMGDEILLVGSYRVLGVRFSAPNMPVGGGIPPGSNPHLLNWR
jgi:hypothetical protein